MQKIDKNDTIYIAGHTGLAGSALLKVFKENGHRNILVRRHSELDLLNQAATSSFFEQNKPDLVILAAARVGGIVANAARPAEFIAENLAIQVNVIDAAYRAGVTRLLFLGSSCIYPKHATQPIREEYLLSGALESTNEAYAIAKIAGLKMCAAYNRQYNTDYLAVMPTNLYGPGDSYDLENSHVLPALIRKMHEAKIRNEAYVEIWGTGTPRREFLYSEDLARACYQLVSTKSSVDIGEFINVGNGVDISILELSKVIKRVVGFEGQLVFNTGRPDGTPRKVLDVSRLKSFGWNPVVEFEQGISLAYIDFLKRFG